MRFFCKICGKDAGLKYKNLYDNRHGYRGKFNIFQCRACGFMQTEPQLTFGKLSSVYTSYYPKRNADLDGIVLASKNMPAKEEISRKGLGTTCHFQAKKKQKVLDIGCGTCQSLLEIKKIGAEAWGLDPDKNSLQVAKELKLRFHPGTIHNCTFPKRYFDLITASQVLEHEGNPIKFMEQCNKFLKKNGKIVLSFPNTNAFYRKLWGANWLHWHVPYHLNHFNKKSLEILAKKSGWKITSLKTITPNLWTVLQIRSYLNNVKEGKRDLMWDGRGDGLINRNRSIQKGILTLLLPHIDRLFIVNRFLDRVGLGESFVVELRQSPC
jgi:2-polyprenyl-3-methyl-5-hydroxy-6-metoxy-1,4-benzoquinol methylase